MARILTIFGIIVLATLAIAYQSFDDGLPPLPPDDQGRGTFTFAVPNDPGSLDPGTTSASSDFRVVKLLYEPLLVVKWGGGGIEPGTADAMPTISEDGLTYTFNIREDAKWSDGHPVSSHDFVYGWRRAMLPDSASDYASLFFLIEGAEEFFTWRQGLLKIDSLDEVIKDDAEREAFLDRYPDLAEQSREMSAQEKWQLTLDQFDKTVGVKAPDDRTLVVTLKSPTAYFVDLAAFPTFSPMPEHVFEEKANDLIRFTSDGAWRIDDPYFNGEDDQPLVTNGPYELNIWEQKVRMIFDQNPHYWNKQAMGNIRVVQETIQDTSLQVLQYEDGQLDWIPDVGGIGKKLVKTDYQDLHKVLVSGTYYYQFNCRPKLPNGVDNPMTDRRVRQALAMCINRKEIVENVTEMYEPTAKLIVPVGSVVGYDGPEDKGLEYNRSKARKLLAEAGYPDGEGFPSIEILVNNEAGTSHADIALPIKKNWEDHLGLDVELEQVEFKVLLDRSNRGNFYVRRAGWFGDYADPTTWLDMFREKDSNNESAYENPAYDELLEQASVELDRDKRFDLLAEAEGILMQDAPVVPLYYYINVMIFDEDKVDLRPNAWNNFRLELVPMPRNEDE